MSTGIKIALPGYDARTAPDYDLSFSSNWPMLQVVKTFSHIVTEADVSVADPAFSGTTYTVTFTHNLGYFAFADAWAYSEDTNFGGVVARRLNSAGLYTLYFGKNTIKAPVASQQSSLYPTEYIPTPGTTIHVKVYSFDFTKPFNYSAILPPSHQNSYDPHVGIKIARSGRDIKSRDLRSFIIHSKGCAPQLLTVQTLENGSVTTKSLSSTQTTETVNYQIPSEIPARVDFLYSTDAASWEKGTGSTNWSDVVESGTNVAYYATVFGQYDVQSQGDVSYSMSNTGLITSIGLFSPVAFSLIVRRDPLLYSTPTVLTI